MPSERRTYSEVRGMNTVTRRGFDCVIDLLSNRCQIISEIRQQVENERAIIQATRRARLRTSLVERTDRRHARTRLPRARERARS